MLKCLKKSQFVQGILNFAKPYLTTALGFNKENTTSLLNSFSRPRPCLLH
ncbi:hypothetical protein ENHYD8BJ_30086 [Enhydrobacter sp. 8BJ]|nr:hypothetical protein ENHYD8BJ_30086 [Enhydrobacter sp. 8BJ]